MDNEQTKTFDDNFNLIYNKVSDLIEKAKGENPKNDDYINKLERTMKILNNLQNCNDPNCDGIIDLINAAKGQEGEVNIGELLESIEKIDVKEKEGGNRNKSSKNKKKKKKNKTKKRRRKYNKNSLAY
jgi:hypothetical protein